MKPEHKDLSPTELALLTWYQPDNPKYRDPLHPTLKLAGEVGELLDLYAKHKYKPGFDWMQCKFCIEDKDWHNRYDNQCNSRKLRVGINLPHSTITYIPKVLDELGDIWYYLRILAWIEGKSLKSIKSIRATNELENITFMNANAARIAYWNDEDNFFRLDTVYTYLLRILNILDCTLDQLTELNYLKLNSESTNHGWKEAK